LKRFSNRLSPATVIASIALFVSLGGVSYGVATGSIDSREIKNNTIRSKDIRNSQVYTQDIRNSTVRGKDVRNNTLTGADILESSLGKVPSAASADNANTVSGKSANDLLTSSGFNENAAVITSLGTSFVDVASANITTHSNGRVLASGSVELFGSDAVEEGQCQIVIDGVASLQYETSPDATGANNSDVVAVEFARTLPAGTHTASLQCRAVTVAAVGKDDAAINVFGLGA
jgi:hypothetical protein